MSTSTDTILLEQSLLNNEDDQIEEQISAEEYLRREKAIKGTGERFLNGENTDDEGWRSEALAIIADIRPFVDSISISTVLPCDNNGVYLNLKTKEAICLTIELSSAGFRICGQDFDKLNDQQLSTNECDSYLEIFPNENNNESIKISLNNYYETPYSLLDTISPSYRNSFSNELAQRLMKLCQ